MSIWTKKKPPSPGWYQASYSKQPDIFRWWDGKVWSYPVSKNVRYDKKKLNAIVAVKTVERKPDHRIFWNTLEFSQRKQNGNLA